jgi:hypothetical protein
VISSTIVLAIPNKPIQIALALNRSDEYMRGRTCCCCKAVNFKTKIRKVNLYSWRNQSVAGSGSQPVSAPFYKSIFATWHEVDTLLKNGLPTYLSDLPFVAAGAVFV